MGLRDERGRPTTSLRPRSRDYASIAAEDNTEFERAMMYGTTGYRGLLSDPIAMYGFDASRVAVDPDVGDGASYVFSSDSKNPLSSEDTIRMGPPLAASRSVLGHEARHRGMFELWKVARQNPQAFKDKYGADAYSFLDKSFVGDSQAQSKSQEGNVELFDDPRDAIYSQGSDVSRYNTLGDTINRVRPEFTNLLAGNYDQAPHQQYSASILRRSMLGLEDAAVDLLREQGRMPYQPTDDSGPSQRLGNRHPQQSKGLLGRILGIFGG
jgi:hypothetical protein